MSNPFPGLRPFEYHEQELFFGREEQYEQMVAKLAATRFLAVVGTSGSGKSSLVRAGLLPALHGGEMMSAGSKWRVALFRPKEDPIRELARALNHPRVFGKEFIDDGSPLLNLGDLIDWPALCTRLNDDAKNSGPSPGGRVLQFLSPATKKLILQDNGRGAFETIDQSRLVDEFNLILKQKQFYQPEGFERIKVPEEAQRLLDRGTEHLSEEEIHRLNRHLLDASFPREIKKDAEIQTRITEVSLRRGDLGLIETVRQAKMPDGENLLIVVDQFEELFRYARISENGPTGNQAAAFVKLLLEGKEQREVPIYVVLTMRSDYLGDCAKFWDLPEAINDGQYLTPRLTRDQQREAIKGPIKLRGADITPQLVNQLLNDMGDNPDQLPILQHALMRTWQQWEQDSEVAGIIDVPHYEAIGRMSTALSRHADEAYDELPDDHSREVARRVFRCLTERGSENREIRRPTSLREIRAITNAKVRELIPVIDVFRRGGRSFLLPSAKRELTRHMSIDISHESLIRNWERLKDWVKEEARAATTYRRLAETAWLYSKNKASRLSELEVEYVIKWLDENKPNLAWASRYHQYLNEDLLKEMTEGDSGDALGLRDERIFRRAVDFLNDSRTYRKQQREAKRKKHRAVLRRTQGALGIIVVLALVFAVIGIFAYRNKKAAEDKEKFANLLAYNVNIDSAEKAFLEGNYAHAYSLLDTLRDKKYEELRGVEWDLLTRRPVNDVTPLNKLGRSKLQSDEAMLATAFLPDKTSLAAVSADGYLKIWKSNSWEQIEQEAISFPFAPATSAAFSIAGDKLAIISKDRAEVFVYSTAKIATEFPEKPETWNLGNQVALAFAISPDGSKIASIVAPRGSSDLTKRTVQLHELSSNQSTTLDLGLAQTTFVSSLVFAGNDNLAVGCSDGTIKFSAKPETLTSADDSTRRAGSLRNSDSLVQTLAISPDLKWLAGGYVNRGIRIWSLTTGVAHSLLNRDASVALMFSPNGNSLASAGMYGSIRIWPSVVWEREGAVDGSDLQDADHLLLGGQAGSIPSVAFLAGSAIMASASEDHTVAIWDISKREVVTGPLPGQTPEPSAATFARLQVEAKQNPLSITGESDPHLPPLLLSPLPNDGAAERFVLRLPNGELKFLKRTADGFAEITGTLVRPEDCSNVAAVRISDIDGRTTLSIFRMGSGGQGVIDRLDATTLQPILDKQWSVPMGDGPPVTDPKQFWFSRFSHDGLRLAVWNSAKGILVFDTSATERSKPEWQHTQTLLAEGTKFNAGDFSPDLRFFVESVNSQKLRIYDLQSESCFHCNESPTGNPVVSIAFSPDGKELATGLADNSVAIWEVDAWSIRKVLNGRGSPVAAMEFASMDKSSGVPFYRRLMTAGADGIKVWDTTDDYWKNSDELQKILGRQELVTIPLWDKSSVAAFALSYDDRSLFMVRSNGTVGLVIPASPNIPSSGSF